MVSGYVSFPVSVTFKENELTVVNVTPDYLKQVITLNKPVYVNAKLGEEEFVIMMVPNIASGTYAYSQLVGSYVTAGSVGLFFILVTDSTVSAAYSTIG